MPLLVDSPLFSATAAGVIRKLGSFRRRGTKYFLAANLRGNPTPVPATANLRACFKAAKQLHAAITPTWSFVAGRWRALRSPAWPAYWAQYLIDNPDCFSTAPIPIWDGGASTWDGGASYWD